MTSLEKAQKALIDKGYSPSQVEEITTELTNFAAILIDEFRMKKTDKNNG
jgi:hypothetical protein